MADPQERIDGIEEAIAEADFRWHVFVYAKDPLSQAGALVRLSSAMHDLKTWHRGYDVNDGMLPWEREDES